MQRTPSTRRELLGRFGTAASAIAVGVTVAGCTGGGDRDGVSGDENVVGLGHTAFSPQNMTLQTGDTVTWKNDSQVGHTVTAYGNSVPQDAEYFASGGFDSEQAAREAVPDEGIIESGNNYEHTFETIGDYDYFCIRHEGQGMTASINVEE